jgi:hypothetical protein
MTKKQKEYFYVILDHGYDGITQPLIITEDIKEAKAFFDEQVEQEKQQYGADVCLFSSLKDTTIEIFDNSEWNRVENLRKWKEQNPGKEPPVYKPWVCTTTTPGTPQPEYKLDAYVTINPRRG